MKYCQKTIINYKDITFSIKFKYDNEEKGVPAHNYRDLYKHKGEKKQEDYQSTYNFYEQEPQKLNIKGQC